MVFIVWLMRALCMSSQQRPVLVYLNKVADSSILSHFVFLKSYLQTICSSFQFSNILKFTNPWSLARVPVESHQTSQILKIAQIHNQIQMGMYKNT